MHRTHMRFVLKAISTSTSAFDDLAIFMDHSNAIVSQKKREYSNRSFCLFFVCNEAVSTTFLIINIQHSLKHYFISAVLPIDHAELCRVLGLNL